MTAARLQGDTAKARKSSQDFFALWKDVDADLPVLIEAKKEYANLKQAKLLECGGSTPLCVRCSELP